MQVRKPRDWAKIELIIINWWIFATLSLIFTIYMLNRNIKDKNMQIREMRGEIEIMQHNFEVLDEQYPNSEVILKLEK